MILVGYLRLNNPIALLYSKEQPLKGKGAGTPGLVLLEKFDLENGSLFDIEAAMADLSCSAGQARGFVVKGSGGASLMEAASLAQGRGYLMELDLSDQEAIEARAVSVLVKKLKATSVTLSVRIKAGSLGDMAAKTLREAGLDLLHLDLKGNEGAAQNIIKRLADSGSPKLMLHIPIGDFEEARSLLSMGAEMISMDSSADPEFVDWLSLAMKEYHSLTGWYNAPRHICSGGDLRGLAFCCPPIKNCPVHGALRKMGIKAEEYIERKMELSTGTLLEHGDGTCFGSLVWCCKISKPCFMRDAALKKLRLSEKDYMALKRQLASDLLGK
jgi:putative methanogenesis marker domain 9